MEAARSQMSEPSDMIDGCMDSMPSLNALEAMAASAMVFPNLLAVMAQASGKVHSIKGLCFGVG